MDISDSLKPCPFCGKKATQSYQNGKYGPFGYIECMICSARSRTVKILEPGRFDSEDDFYSQRAWETAFVAWNNRAYESDEGKD